MKTQKLIEANKTIVGWNENRIHGIYSFSAKQSLDDENI